MKEVVTILGNGFDRDLGINLSFGAYCRCPKCLAYVEHDEDEKPWAILKMIFATRYWHGMIIELTKLLKA